MMMIMMMIIKKKMRLINSSSSHRRHGSKICSNAQELSEIDLAIFVVILLVFLEEVLGQGEVAAHHHESHKVEGLTIPSEERELLEVGLDGRELGFDLGGLQRGVDFVATDGTAAHDVGGGERDLHLADELMQRGEFVEHDGARALLVEQLDQASGGLVADRATSPHGGAGRDGHCGQLLGEDVAVAVAIQHQPGIPHLHHLLLVDLLVVGSPPHLLEIRNSWSSRHGRSRSSRGSFFFFFVN